MFERFSEKARRALFFSRYEASQVGSRIIDSEHLLLGLLREQDELMRLCFDAFHIDERQIRNAYPHVTDRTTSTSAELPLTLDAVCILNDAEEEADAKGSAEIEPRHILLGILKAETSTAAKQLAEYGLTHAEGSAFL